MIDLKGPNLIRKQCSSGDEFDVWEFFESLTKVSTRLDNQLDAFFLDNHCQFNIH
jgi:hypothetical protein